MELYQKALQHLRAARPFALATIVKASGSTPQKAGAMALIQPDGSIQGTLGGGCLEMEARRRALIALDDGVPVTFDLSLDEDYGWDDGLICGGNVRIDIDPDVRRNAHAYEACIAAHDLRDRGVLISMFRPDRGAHWLPDGEDPADIPVPADVVAIARKREFPLWWQSEDRTAEAMLLPVTPQPQLLIAGGGHVGQAVAHQAARLGFEVTVVDDRARFTDTALYPFGTRTICGDIAKELEKFPTTSDTYILIVTRGHRHDDDALRACIHSPAAYIGMIGSKRKVLLIREGFIKKGVASETDFQRVHAPVGLDIGAITVEEIAISIVAQLVACRRHPTRANEATAMSICQ